MLVDGGQFTHRGNPPLAQLRGGDLADPPDHLDGQRMQEVEFALGLDDEQAVGFGDAARDLGEELRSRDADGDRQSDLRREPFAQPLRDDSAACRTTRCSPPTSRNASSIEMPSTSGVVSRKTSNTALLAASYASNRAGTSIAWGHNRRACRPPIAVRTPYALAS